VVEVETSGYKSEVKLPIAALVAGQNCHTLLDISLPDPPATLRLVQGSGPVHLAGVHAIQVDNFTDDEEDEEDMLGKYMSHLILPYLLHFIRSTVKV